MTEDHIPEGPNSDEEPDTNGLTSIQGCIHCAATNEGGEPDNELDRISVEDFLDTLSKVALSIATRQQDAEGQARD